MTAIVVLLELEPATEVVDPDVGETDIGARVRAVHAAEPDPRAPGAPLPRTLCGVSSDELEPEPYTPAGPDAPWYPPEHHARHCLDCDAALHSS
ncbi:hypothetical protein [Streptacidiphilus jiangxiensis]|uniref:Uncharacterized protein n=1 Tax=Streptacidiphilus jiangxiensis TaxID=235985 RepID=A0A1H7V3B0_STRJI|nr:hypothetical protein [Streptacidiphilus jiangxiensis]SEM03630.1 hypothetical protein SAMN05414137_11748 [Streptacidiphilus jiangxiensis]